MNRRGRFCLTLYRRLAGAYPHEFRMLYGEEPRGRCDSSAAHAKILDAAGQWR